MNLKTLLLLALLTVPLFACKNEELASQKQGSFDGVLSAKVKEQLEGEGIFFDEDDFTLFDTDKDDVLTQEEMKQAIKDAAGDRDIVKYQLKLAMESDLNSDGKLERREFREHNIEQIKKIMFGEYKMPREQDTQSKPAQLRPLQFQLQKKAD